MKLNKSIESSLFLDFNTFFGRNILVFLRITIFSRMSKRKLETPPQSSTEEEEKREAAERIHRSLKSHNIRQGLYGNYTEDSLLHSVRNDIPSVFRGQFVECIIHGRRTMRYSIRVHLNFQ